MQSVMTWSISLWQVLQRHNTFQIWFIAWERNAFVLMSLSKLQSMLFHFLRETYVMTMIIRWLCITICWGNLHDFGAVKHALNKGEKKFSWKVMKLWMIFTTLRIFSPLVSLVWVKLSPKTFSTYLSFRYWSYYCS